MGWTAPGASGQQREGWIALYARTRHFKYISTWAGQPQAPQGNKKKAGIAVYTLTRHFKYITRWAGQPQAPQGNKKKAGIALYTLTRHFKEVDGLDSPRRLRATKRRLG